MFRCGREIGPAHLPDMRRRVRIAVIVMGFSGLIAEIFLLRELLIVFSGNELSIGIILANWLLLEAAGCIWPGRMIDRTARKLEAFALVTILFSIALIAAVFAARLIKVALGVSIGEHVGLLPMFYTSLLVLLPVSVLHGALFTFSCSIYAMQEGTESRSGRRSAGRQSAASADGTVAGRVYVDETVGTIAGGVAGTFVLIPLLNSFEVVIGTALVNMLACTWLLAPGTRMRHGERREAGSEHLAGKEVTERIAPTARPASSMCRATGILAVVTGILAVATGILAIAAGIALLTGQAGRIHQESIDLQWGGHNVVHYHNSPYSNITVLENQGQYLFFLDGIPEIITPMPDMLFVEEFVHLPMLAHPDPREVLILRGGAGGMIDEVLKHPSVRQVTYAEHDPAFLEVIRAFPTPMTESELGDERVRVRYRDGRLLLATSPQTYDIIFIGVLEPSNLQANRFFTREFFSLARGRLNEGGILVLTVPGSLTFLSDELKNLNSSIFHTLVDVFPHIRTIPGDHRNLFLASADREVADLDLDRMVRRLDERQIQADGVVPWHIEKKLHDGWRRWFHDYIQGASSNINRDFNPVGLFYHIAHWNSLYAPAFGRVYNRFEDAGPGTLLPPLALFTLLVLLLNLRRRKGGGIGVPYAIVTTGFAGMLFSLIVIFMFQVTYGNVFSWIGLLVACFMAGAAAGALLVNRMLMHMGDEKRWFLTVEAAIISFTLVLPLIFLAVHPLLDSPLAFDLFRLLFLALSLIAGMLVGMQYPLANNLLLQRRRGVSATGGMLYASDLLGGWMGGVAGGVVLLPVMGVTGTCLTVALLKISSFLIIAAEPEGRHKQILP
jgi:spermidine synthase